jgi:hypothetical protein
VYRRNAERDVTPGQQLLLHGLSFRRFRRHRDQK